MSKITNLGKEDERPVEGLSQSAFAVRLRFEASGLTDFAPGIEAAFPPEVEECDCAIDRIEGHIPPFVRGVYYLNGPARFGAKEFRYQHWLDGDGMVCALHFEGRGAQLKSRFVRSSKFTTERSAGRPLFRAFGTGFPGSLLNRSRNGLESAANMSVYSFGDHLLASGRQGLPWELDPETLETRGQFTFYGGLSEASPFSAYPRRDPDSGEMFNFGIALSETPPKLYFYSFGPEGLRHQAEVALEYPYYANDFALSRRYAIFYLSPYLLEMDKVVQKGGTMMDALRWEPTRGSKLLILRRSTGDLFASIPIGNRYCQHLINAFEDENNLIVDLMEFDEPIYDQYQPIPNLFQNVARGGPVRLSIDMESRKLYDHWPLGYIQAHDFPVVDPRRITKAYDDFWMLGISAAGKSGRKFFDQLVHANWKRAAAAQVYRAPAMSYLGGEPVFIGDPKSSKAVVLCQEFSARDRRSYFLLFDAYEVARGPIARMPVSHLLHLGFHATFQPKLPQPRSVVQRQKELSG